jgi:putative glycosyltransferase (TIGR04372 family)
MPYQGLSVRIRKWLASVILLPLVLGLYLVSRLLRIRIGRIDAERLGFLAFQPDVYFYNRRFDKTPHLDFFYYEGRVSNLQLMRMWDRVLLTPSFAKCLAKSVARLPGNKCFEVGMEILPNRNYADYFWETRPPISFTDVEAEFGVCEMRRLGIPADGNFFCFTDRAADQFQSCSRSRIEENSYRNFDINDLKTAVRALVGMGSLAVRIGTAPSPLNWAEEGVIDYATASRSDFLDLFLISRCRFVLGPNTGPYVVGKLFRRPVALINVTPLTGANGYFSREDVFIPKKYRSIKENRIMTLSEVMASGAHSILTSEGFKRLGVEVVANTSEEIRDLALEMSARLLSTWECSADEITMQTKYATLVRQGLGITDLQIPRIGTSFLLSNSEFLK